MKFNKSHVALLFTLVVGFFVIYFATHNVDIYVPSSKDNVDNKVVIVLDAGHGGMDSGCVSVTGYEEKHINLAIMSKVRDLCRAMGYKVVTTRDTDISIYDDGVKGVGKQKKSDMDNRLKLFNKYDGAVCVSIHQNQFTQPQYHGAQMFYSGSNQLNEGFAAIMQKQFVSKLQPDNKRETKPTGKEIFLTNFTKNPSLMVECGFLSNEEEAKLLETPEYQSKVAFTIFCGIDEFVKENILNYED